MSRVYQKPSASTARQAPGTRPSLRQPAPSSTSATRGVRAPTRGVRAPTRGRTMYTQPPRPERHNHDDTLDNQTNHQERTIHVGDGYHMFTPSINKREQMRRQAENEQRQYEEHIEQTRLHNIHEVNRLGGDGLSEQQARQKLAEKYRRDKFTRLEKTNQDQIQKKQEEERDLEAKKQAARLQSMENEKRDRNAHIRSMRSTMNQSDEGASGWTDKAREEDRRKTMDQFFHRLTGQYDNMNISSNENETKNDDNLSKSEKFSILHETLPDIDDQTLEHYFEIYDGNIDMIVHELLN